MAEPSMEAQPVTHESALPRKRRRLLWILLCGVVLVAGAVGVAFLLSGQVPGWYHPVSEGTAEDQAQQAINKLATAQNWANERHAWESAHSHGTAKVAEPKNELTVAFSQDEINAFIAKLYSIYSRERVGNQQLSDVFNRPMVVIDSEHITIAGTVPSAGNRVVSLEFQPAVRDGQLDLQLSAVRSGKLLLPEFTWSSLRDQMIRSLSQSADGLRSMAALDRGGAANAEAVSVTLARQGIDILHKRPTMNILFLPVISQNAGLPVHLKSCELQDGMITLTTVPLSAQEREGLLKAMRSK